MLERVWIWLLTVLAITLVLLAVLKSELSSVARQTKELEASNKELAAKFKELEASVAWRQNADYRLSAAEHLRRAQESMKHYEEALTTRGEKFYWGNLGDNLFPSLQDALTVGQWEVRVGRRTPAEWQKFVTAAEAVVVRLRKYLEAVDSERTDNYSWEELNKIEKIISGTRPSYRF
jgi:DNA repair exonuclease SbcCD ATPase subunit